MTTVVIIVTYLVVLLALGAISARRFRNTSDDFFLASRSIGPFLLLMSLFGTTMTAFALVGGWVAAVYGASIQSIDANVGSLLGALLGGLIGGLVLSELEVSAGLLGGVAVAAGEDED